MGLFSLTKIFGLTIRESATDGSDFTNPDADYRRLFLGEDGALHLKNSAGTVTDIGGTGTGSGLSAPDAPPTSPNAADDEFTALSGWTTLGTLDTSNVTDFPGLWHAKRVNGAVACDGIYKAAPSAPFTVTCKLSASNVFVGANYNSAGILLTENAPGKLCTVGLVFNNNALYGSLYRWTNRTTLSTNVDVNLIIDPRYYTPHQYLRLVVASSSDVTFSVSHNGLIWNALTSNANTGLTIANVGLYIGDAAAAGTVEAAFDWIRFT